MEEQQTRRGGEVERRRELIQIRSRGRGVKGQTGRRVDGKMEGCDR